MNDREQEKGLEERQAQDAADLALGRRLRALPDGVAITHRRIWPELQGISSPWMVTVQQGEWSGQDLARYWGETPEEALGAAGIGKEEATEND